MISSVLSRIDLVVLSVIEVGIVVLTGILLLVLARIVLAVLTGVVFKVLARVDLEILSGENSGGSFFIKMLLIVLVPLVDVRRSRRTIRRF